MTRHLVSLLREAGRDAAAQELAARLRLADAAIGRYLEGLAEGEAVDLGALRVQAREAALAGFGFVVEEIARSALVAQAEAAARAPASPADAGPTTPVAGARGRAAVPAGLAPFLDASGEWRMIDLGRQGSARALVDFPELRGAPLSDALRALLRDAGLREREGGTRWEGEVSARGVQLLSWLAGAGARVRFPPPTRPAPREGRGPPPGPEFYG